jgi:pimeloyl-ACP methyl ester carboxylesterase
MICIAYIHGHGATGNSFNFLRAKLDKHLGQWIPKEILLEYDSNRGFAANLQSMRDLLKEQVKGRVFFVAHSLGGIYALHLASHFPCAGGVTMATPYGGSAAALQLNMFSPQPVFKDIHPTAGPITAGRSLTLPKDCTWTALHTTMGHSPLMMGPNDGVVTAASMKEIANFGLGDTLKLFPIAANHHEVVLSHEVFHIVLDEFRAARRRQLRVLDTES